MQQQNMLHTRPIPETEHNHIHQEPCVVPYSLIPSFLQPTNSNHTILPPSRNQISFNPQHLPENGTFTQFNSLDHHLHHPAIANNVFMTHTGALVYPSAINHMKNGQFIDVFKRKNAEGYFCQTHGSNSTIPMNTDGTIIDGPPAVYRSGINMGSGAIRVDPTRLTLGNYNVQPFQPVHNPWLDQQLYGNGINGIAFSWHNNIPGTFVQPPAIMTHHGPHNIHHHPPPPPLPPSMPPMHGPNIDFHSQLASSSHILPANTGFSEWAPHGFVGPTRVFQPMVEETVRHRVFPHLRVLPEDGVAILDISGYREAGHSVDHHRDMRLDIDHMSYEELLALGEQIGSAGSGLSNEFISKHLKTRVFASSKSYSEPENVSSVDQELNACVICQINYDDQEQIGTLDCGHEYHVECVSKWLNEKNTCPICKSTALASKAKEL